MSIRLPVHEHSCACLYMRMYVCMYVHVCVHAHVFIFVCMYVYVRKYVLVPCADPVFWPSGLDPLPLTKILDPRMGLPGCSSINPLKIVK